MYFIIETLLFISIQILSWNCFVSYGLSIVLFVWILQSLCIISLLSYAIIKYRRALFNHFVQFASSDKRCQRKPSVALSHQIYFMFNQFIRHIHIKSILNKFTLIRNFMSTIINQNAAEIMRSVRAICALNQEILIQIVLRIKSRGLINVLFSKQPEHFIINEPIFYTSLQPTYKKKYLNIKLQNNYKIQTCQPPSIVLNNADLLNGFTKKLKLYQHDKKLSALYYVLLNNKLYYNPPKDSLNSHRLSLVHSLEWSRSFRLSQKIWLSKSPIHGIGLGCPIILSQLTTLKSYWNRRILSQRRFS